MTQNIIYYLPKPKSMSDLPEDAEAREYYNIETER